MRQRFTRLKTIGVLTIALFCVSSGYVNESPTAAAQTRAFAPKAFIGAIPDYAVMVQGVKLSGVSKDGPAEKAGVRAGDIVVELAGRKIRNLLDFAKVIRTLRVGKEIEIIVKRKGKEIPFDLIPIARPGTQ